MSILGTVASLYMGILILLLIISFGLVGLKFVNYILSIDRININSKIDLDKPKHNKVEVNKWLRIALYSFIGLMFALLILSILYSTPITSSHM